MLKVYFYYITYFLFSMLQYLKMLSSSSEEYQSEIFINKQGHTLMIFLKKKHTPQNKDRSYGANIDKFNKVQ